MHASVVKNKYLKTTRKLDRKETKFLLESIVVACYEKRS